MGRHVRNLTLGSLLLGLGACESSSLFGEGKIGLGPNRAAPRGTRGQALEMPAPGTVSPRAAPRPLSAQRGQSPKVMIFDVRDLLAVTPSFVAPEMDVFGSGGGPELPEPPIGQAVMDEDTLLDTLRAALPPDALGENATLTIAGGRLIVTNPAK